MGGGGKRIRVYWYVVDLRGRLFLDPEAPGVQGSLAGEQVPSNVGVLENGNKPKVVRTVASAMSDVKFLDGFYTRLVETAQVADRSQAWRDALRTQDVGKYKWASPCGRELNLVRADDTAVVFRDLVLAGEEQASGERHAKFGDAQQDLGPVDRIEEAPPSEARLVYAGSLSVPFSPSQLCTSEASGRFYVRTDTEHGMCLLHPHLALRLSDRLMHDSYGNPPPNSTATPWSFRWQGRVHPIHLVA